MNDLTRREFLARLAGIGLGACRATSATANSRVKARVIVVGGGYGGATAARYLRLAAPQMDITLVHKDPDFVSCPGSNEVIAGIRPAAWLRRGYDRLARRGIRLVHGEVTEIDAEKGIVRLRDRAGIEFDRAILAPGIGLKWDAWEGYDQAASLACPHAWQAGAQTELLRRQLHAMRPGGLAIVVAPPNPYRCPPGPYERASLMAYYLKRHNPRAKILILDAKTQFSKQKLFLQGWKDLYPGMIEWVPASVEGGIERIDANRRRVYSEFGEHHGDLLTVIPPQQAGGIAGSAGLTDRSGWCPVDPRTFASLKTPRIYVIGDACNAAPMPKSAFAANSQAKVCAAAIVDTLEGRSPSLPSLINHCYSFLAPDYAISITGVYEYSAQEGGLIATAAGETLMDADRRVEARQARAWQRNFQRDTFG